MKQVLTILCVMGMIVTQAQAQQKQETKEERQQRYIEEVNPFRELGYKPRISTLSKGKYREAFPDSIVQIGNFTYNILERRITGVRLFEELGISEATAKPEIVSRWMSPDPLSDEFPDKSPYNFVNNNPIRYVDPLGLAPEDWVLGKNGNIYWDNNANDQATTQSGDTYLGKELTFTFNSNIDGGLWDGPGGDAPVGDKLTSTVTLSASENSEGQLTGITATSEIKIGSTPVGTARDYFPGLGDDQNKFSSSQSTKADGTLSSFNLNFEQHASVSKIEQFGLNMMGYDIVNVAQKLDISTSGSNLSISASTDVFPSASLSVNGNQLFRYNQPSFKATHGRDKSFSDNGMGGVDVTTTPRRPTPSFHLRYKN